MRTLWDEMSLILRKPSHTLQVQYAIWSFSGDSHPDTDPGLRALALNAVNRGYDPSGWSIPTDNQVEGPSAQK